MCYRGLMSYPPLVALLCVVAASVHAGDEARINAAIPLSIPAQNALDLLRRVATDRSQLAQLEDQFQTKMRLRALQCSQDYKLAPGASNEDIRRVHGGDPCFAGFDANLADWLGLHSIGYLMALPALRPVAGATSPFISDSAGPIQTVHFAARAGVGIVESFNDTEIIDLTSGVPIFSKARDNEDLITSLSPNGRIYTASNRAAIRFYDATSGALIAAPRWCFIVAHCGFFWLDDRSAMVYSSDTPKSMIFDFRSGLQSPFEGTFDRVERIAELPASSEYLALSNASVMHFRLTYVGEQPRVEFLKVIPLRRNLLPIEEGGLNANARYYSALSDGKIDLTSTNTFATETVDFGRFFVQGLVPTADPDRLIVTGYLMGGPMTPESYVYSIGGRTLAALDTTRMVSTRFMYDQGRNTLYVLSNSQLELVKNLPTAPAVSVAEFVAKLSKGTNSASAPTGLLTPGLPEIAIAGAPKPADPVPGVIADLAKDAEIQGIGVFEADDPQADNNKPGATYVGTFPGTQVSVYQKSDTASTAIAPPRNNTIKVKVRASRQPLILVLSSYASIDWQLTLEPGAQLKAVLLTGTHGSRVTGEGQARVAAIGNAYSYRLGTVEYTVLQNEVYTWTGKRITLFQCGYQASDFTVSGT